MPKYTIHILELDRELDNAVNPTKKYKWTDLYTSEEELLSELIEIDEEICEDIINPFAPLFLGFDFLPSLSNRLKSGQELSPKQMTQAKRLAKQIRKAYIVMQHVKKHNQQ